MIQPGKGLMKAIFQEMVIASGNCRRLFLLQSNLETTERTDCFIPKKQGFAMTVIHVSSKPVHEFLNLTVCCHLLKIHSIFLPIMQNSF